MPRPLCLFYCFQGLTVALGLHALVLVASASIDRAASDGAETLVLKHEMFGWIDCDNVNR